MTCAACKPDQPAPNVHAMSMTSINIVKISACNDIEAAASCRLSAVVRACLAVHFSCLPDIIDHVGFQPLCFPLLF